MANFKLEVTEKNVVAILNQPFRRWMLPRRMFTQMQLLQVENITLEKVYKGVRWNAVLFARHIDPPLVLQIVGPEPGMKELGEGLRLRAFLAQIAMEGETPELIDQLLDDIWHERDFASNTNTEIVEDGDET